MTTELTINGYKLEIGPISPLAPKAIEVQYRKKNPMPEAPTYTVDAVGGVTETFKHTSETVETEEEIKALEEYNDAIEEWQTGLTQRVMKLFFALAVTLKLTKKQEEEMETKLEMLEMEVPEKETERNVLFLEMFVINSADTMKKIIEAVLAETGIKEEALEAANALFPDSVE